MRLRMPERPVHMLSAPCVPALLLLHQSIKIALSRTFSGDEVRDDSSDTSVRKRRRNKNTAVCLPSVLNKEFKQKLNADFSLYTQRNHSAETWSVGGMLMLATLMGSLWLLV